MTKARRAIRRPRPYSINLLLGVLFLVIALSVAIIVVALSHHF
jgi:hypothetical protein